LATILSQWGRSHACTIRVSPTHCGQLERPLLAKLLRRLQYLPYREVCFDHPADDTLMTQLLYEANFQRRRVLVVMRLDLV